MRTLWIATAGLVALSACADDNASALIATSDEAAGENCANGGTRVDVGLDEDGSGELESGEVESTSYICNGSDGVNGNDGEDGVDPLVSVTEIAPGDDCTFGGVRVDAGVDDNGDGELGAKEVDDTVFVCSNGPVRFATFNASLNRNNAGQLITDLTATDNAQALQVAEIIQIVRPDVLLVNEFDYEPTTPDAAPNLFRSNYLEVSQNGQEPIAYPYVYVAPSNTGTDSGIDIDGNGNLGDAGDAFGFGFFEGQFAMVVFSRYPIDTTNVRTFQNFLWQDMPGALLPDDDETAAPGDFYPQNVLDVFRLSSKSHWDLPIQLGDRTVHFLTSHPTPPVFDGPEDRNGTRNHDEIRFWVDYVTPGNGDYIYDDTGALGGLPSGESFVVAGDQNADPFDGDSTNNAADQLVQSPLVNDESPPTSLGGTEQAELQGEINLTHTGDPAFDTADFGDSNPGNLRVDYVVPSKDLVVTDSGVFWPASTDPAFALVSASDHRLVFIDVLP